MDSIIQGLRFLSPIGATVLFMCLSLILAASAIAYWLFYMQLRCPERLRTMLSMLGIIGNYGLFSITTYFITNGIRAAYPMYACSVFVMSMGINYIFNTWKTDKNYMALGTVIVGAFAFIAVSLLYGESKSLDLIIGAIVCWGICAIFFRLHQKYMQKNNEEVCKEAEAKRTHND